MSAAGWAIKDCRSGVVDVATVAPTRRGAIVNSLVTRFGMPIHNGMSDGLIETIWLKRTDEETRCRAVLVRIEEVTQ